MSEYERLFVRLPIYVDPKRSAFCNQASSGASDGCPAFNHYDEGGAFCGAFGVELVPVDDDANDEYAFHHRAGACLRSEIL